VQIGVDELGVALLVLGDVDRVDRQVVVDALQRLAVARVAPGQLGVLALTLCRLVAPFPPPVPTNFSYWLVTLPETADTPRIAAFRAWLLDEAGTTGAP